MLNLEKPQKYNKFSSLIRYLRKHEWVYTFNWLIIDLLNFNRWNQIRIQSSIIIKNFSCEGCVIDFTKQFKIRWLFRNFAIQSKS